MSVIATDGFRRIEMLRVGDDGVHAGSDVVVEEVAIALSYNGTGHAVMMATALDLEDFALGFSLHEGIVAAMEELRFIEALPRDGGVVVELAIPQTRFDSLMQRARHTLGIAVDAARCRGVFRCSNDCRRAAPVPVAAVTQCIDRRRPCCGVV